jgi:hypothetical protein
VHSLRTRKVEHEANFYKIDLQNLKKLGLVHQAEQIALSKKKWIMAFYGRCDALIKPDDLVQCYEHIPAMDYFESFQNRINALYYDGLN